MCKFSGGNPILKNKRNKKKSTSNAIPSVLFSDKLEFDGAYFQTEPTETETLHSLTPQVRREKGVVADPPHSPHPGEESGSAGRESGLRGKTINWEKIPGSAAKHLTGPTHGQEEGRQKGRRRS